MTGPKHPVLTSALSLSLPLLVFISFFSPPYTLSLSCPPPSPARAHFISLCFSVYPLSCSPYTEETLIFHPAPPLPPPPARFVIVIVLFSLFQDYSQCPVDGDHPPINVKKFAVCLQAKKPFPK